MSQGSITKEFPIESIDETIQAITPGMTYSQLREFATAHTNNAIPALLCHRFLLVNTDGTITDDRFLSLVNSEGIDTPRLRKIMYFVWAFRDDRIRRFILEIVADRNGLWRPNQLTRKANATFFKEFFKPGTAPKVRSNVERFLAETGIFNPKKAEVHLELSDGWLIDALRVAAQHEPNLAVRRSMVNAPYEFIISRNWQGLVNATADTLQGLTRSVTADEEPMEDEEIEVSPVQLSPSRRWNRPRPNPGKRATATGTLDLVARERASTAHHTLERIVAEAARGKGYDPLYNDQIDMHFTTPEGAVLAEMKSCHGNNLHAQVRRGISQLLEYRYVYRDRLAALPRLRRPGRAVRHGTSSGRYRNRRGRFSRPRYNRRCGYR